MLVVVLSLFLFQVCLTEFTFDPVLIAVKPKGFKLYIEDQPDMKEVRFLGRLNNRRSLVMWVTKQDNNGRWTQHNKNIELNIGDEIKYEITVWKKDKSEYSKNETWTVLYFESPPTGCLKTATFASGVDSSPCGSKVIFEDDFLNSELNTSLWTVEQYIPQYTEDNYEFVSYEDISDCKFISNSRLFLKPVLRSNEEMRSTLDLRSGCTRSAPEACFHKQLGAYIVPPIKSAKITSKVSFKYGRVEIGARLPIGDWIYPQIELIPKDMSKKYPKFLIGFARGNLKLTLHDGNDIGCNLLFGGYVHDWKEPERSKNLKSTNIQNTTGDIKLFSVIWTPDKLFMIYDGQLYGRIDLTTNLGEYRISLGVGVGGNFDFPDNIKSDETKKPWRNDDVKQAKRFADAKDTWFSTWRDNDVALQVDYVKLYAL